MPRKDHGDSVRGRQQGQGLTFKQRDMAEFFAAENFITGATKERIGAKAVEKMIDGGDSFITDNSFKRGSREKRSE